MSQKGGEGKGASHDVAEMIERSNAGRERKRKEAKLAERQRTTQEASGELFRRLNEGRNNNINDLVACNVGEYAFPGGNKPSAHFRVWMVKSKDPTKMPMAVVAFDHAQRGHELTGVEWKTDIYLPVFRIMRSGPNFVSNFKSFEGKTQEMLCHYLYKVAEEKRLSEEKAKQTELERVRKEAEERRLAEEKARLDGIKRARLEARAKAEKEELEKAKKVAESKMAIAKSGTVAMSELSNMNYGVYLLPFCNTYIEVKDIKGRRGVELVFSEHELLIGKKTHLPEWLVRNPDMVSGEVMRMPSDCGTYKRIATLHMMVRQALATKPAVQEAETSQSGGVTEPSRKKSAKPAKAPAPSGKKVVKKRRKPRGVKVLKVGDAALALSEKFPVRGLQKVEQRIEQ